MSEAEQRGLPYLFKLRQSERVKKLILQQHCRPGWEQTLAGWEALTTDLKLSSWKTSRRVVLVRRKLSGSGRPRHPASLTDTAIADRTGREDGGL